MLLAILITVGVLGYLGCGVLAYGLWLGYIQRHYWEIREKRDGRITAIGSIGGPMSLLSALIIGEWGYHGILWRARGTSEGHEDEGQGHERYPDREPVVAARSDRPGS